MNENIIISDFESIKGLSFFSVAQLKRECHISNATAKKILSQPGYNKTAEKAVTKTVNGGWRLYERVGQGMTSEWMDASLNDMAK